MVKINTKYFWILRVAISTQRYFETLANIQIGIEDILGKVFVSSNYSGATHYAWITLNFTIIVQKGVGLLLEWSTYLLHMGYLLPYSQIQDWEFLLWTDCLTYRWDWEKVYRIDLGSQSFVETSAQTYNDFLMSFDILHNKNGFVGHGFISWVSLSWLDMARAWQR